MQTSPASGRDIRHSVLYLLPVAVGVGLPILSLPILTRVLSTQEYGAWALANVFGSVATAVASFGLPAVYERNFFEQQSPQARGALLTSIVAFVATVLLAVGVAAWFARRQVSLWMTGSPEYGALMFFSFCAAAVLGIKSYYLTYFRNSGDARAYVRYVLDETVTGTLLSLLFVAVLRTGVIGMALGALIASSVVLGLAVVRARREIPAAVDWALLRSSLRLSYPLAPRVFLKLVSSQFDKYVISLLASVGGVGVYAAGQRIAYTVFTLTTALENVFAPEVYRRMFQHEGKDGDGRVAEYLTPFLYISVGAALLLVSLSPEVLRVLVAPSYVGAVPISALLAVSYAVMFFGKLPQLMFGKRTWLLGSLTIVNVALNVGLCTWFARRGGALGAAFGTMLAAALSTAVYMVLGQREFPIAWRWRPVGAMFVLLGMAAAVVVVEPPAIISVVGRTIVAAAYAWLGVHLRILTASNVHAVVSAISGRAAEPSLVVDSAPAR